MLKAKLVVVGGDAKSKEVNLKLPCVIGRGREATLTLPHPLVSRQHTEIFEKDGKLYVKDLSSLNGTFLNNKRLESEAVLEPNQLLTLGNVTFRAVYEIGDSTVSSDLETVSAAADTESVAAKPDDSLGKTADSTDSDPIVDRETVYDDEKKSDAEETDKSLLGGESISARESANGSSDIFGGIESGEPDHSAVSSVEGLPEAAANASFAGGIDLGDDKPSQQAVEAINLDLGVESKDNNDDDSGLDSFINKLPR